VTALYSCYLDACYMLGRGVFAKSDVDAGAFLCQYNGELISGNEGEQREHSIPSCFRFIFKYGGKNGGM